MEINSHVYVIYVFAKKFVKFIPYLLIEFSPCHLKMYPSITAKDLKAGSLSFHQYLKTEPQ